MTILLLSSQLDYIQCYSGLSAHFYFTIKVT